MSWIRFSLAIGITLTLLVGLAGEGPPIKTPHPTLAFFFPFNWIRPALRHYFSDPFFPKVVRYDLQVRMEGRV